MWSFVSRRTLAVYSVLVLVSVVFSGFLVASFSPADAQEKRNDRDPMRTESHVAGLDNYDIRSDKSDDAFDRRTAFRASESKSAAYVADIREDFARGESDLKLRVPTLKVEYNTDIRIPEVIAPDVKQGRAFLTRPSNENRVESLRSFARSNSLLTGVDANQVDDLKVLTDYTNPNGELSFTHLQQEINGIPVFRGEIKAGFTKRGEIIRVINNLAPGLDYDSLNTEFGDPLDAVKAAAGHIDYKLQEPDVTLNNAASKENVAIFGEGDWATTAEKIYFPLEPGVARTAWRVLIWQPVNAFYVIVDAETGVMLWRKNITEDQTQAATYEVYRNSNAFIDLAESPAPLTPGPIDPGLGTQGALLTRENVTLVGNEGSLSFNNNGWITDDTNGVNGLTDGNINEAGLDIDGIQGVDSPIFGTNRSFSSAWNPPPGDPAPGDAPTVPAAQTGAVIHMFYAVNRYHDALYQVGFTESAFNFQHDNFGRGGLGFDRVSSQGQDSSGTNNANFSTPADGGRGRMQMYRFTGPNPDRDGTADTDVIIHELTHGTSNRLHGNASGLTTDMARGMGEGWGDWYAHVLTAEPSDPINGVYSEGGYLLNTASNSANFYHGIRSLPTAVMAFTGGTGNRPHNSLTFKDIDQTQAANNDAAFPARFGPNFNSPHFRGEVWKSALWEVRCLLVTRLGFTAGTERSLQIVTDGMKLAPTGPTFLQERDAILAAASAISLAPEAAATVADVWEGFRIRGMGYSASVEGNSPVRVTEAFDAPNVDLVDAGFNVSDSQGDGDGFPEPGELLSVTIPIHNATGQTVNSVTVNLNGGSNINYGNIPHGSTVSNQIPFTVPGGTPCGSALTLTINIGSSVGPRAVEKGIIIGEPALPAVENFDGVTAPALPSGWVTAATGPGNPFTTVTNPSDSVPNSAFTPNVGTSGGNSGATLESVSYAINSDAAVVSFRNSYNTEIGWDGGVLELSIGGGSYLDIQAAGGSFLEGGYNTFLGSNQNPLDGRLAWSGNSGGYITSVAQLPPSANGQNVKFRWRFGEDTNTVAPTGTPGWSIDGIEVFSGYTCSVTPSTGNTRFDFDGDSKTDIGIFRPGPGEWWYLRSSDGGSYAAQFGSGTDAITPADFTGDGKADIAFFRPTSGEWFILRSEDNSFFAFPFGANGDIPAPGDFDGDGKADPAVFRPSIATWFYIRSSDQQVVTTQFGLNGDQPIVEDYDGDGKDDLAVFRPSVAEWYLNRSTDGFIGYQFGPVGDTTPAVADFTGDGKADITFFKPSSSEWFVLRSEDNSFFAFPFGTTGDIPVPGDYDGDGTADPAVFRPSTNSWFLQQTTSGFEQVQFGITNDIPVPSAYVP